MKKRFFIPFFIITPFILFILSITYGKNLSFEKQKEIYTILLTISSIVLTITGIWIALIFPEKFKSNETKNSKNENNIIPDIGMFFKPLVYSTIVVIFSFLTLLIGNIATTIPYLVKYKEIGRIISLSLLIGFSFCSIYSLYLTISLANLIKINSDKKNSTQRIVDLYIKTENELSESDLNKIKDPD